MGGLTMEKNRFLTFITSLIPGAGHMYLGLMKKGLILMGLFGFSISFCDFLNFNLIGFIPPVIWFYCFFDTWRLCKSEYQDRLIDEAHFLMQTKNFLKQDWGSFLNKYAFPIGVVIIILGIYTFLSRFILPYLYRFGGYYSRFLDIFYNIPIGLFSLIFVGAGIYLIYHHKIDKD